MLLPGQGRVIEMGGFQMTLKAGEAESGGAFSLLEAEEPAGFGPPLHIHHDALEAFYVLEGEYEIFIDDTATACPAGSFILIPAGVTHGFRVGNRPSRKLNLYAPAGMVGYFDALSAASLAGDMPEAELAALAAEHHMEVVGPVPEGYH